MNDREFDRPIDPELEDALAFVAQLKSQHSEDTASAPAPQTAKREETTAAPEAAPEELLVLTPPATLDAEDEPEEEAPKKKKGGFLRFLHHIIPVAGDPWWEVSRKLLFLAATVVFIGSMAMLLNEAVVIPKKNEGIHQELWNIRNDPQAGQLTEAEAAFDGYPEGITTDFKKLYYLNNDVRGWLTYKSCGVDEVVMYSSTRDFYLTHDFYRNSNKNGSLFFDVENNLSSASSHYKSLVIYGHNMASGQMFAGLNQLAGSVDTMKRAGSIVQLDTLYRSDKYKIFAVLLQDPNSKIEHYYSIQTTSFSSDLEFVNYVAGLRARSLYDFNGVDVTASDDILIMYTCSPKSVAGFDDARLAVVARRVREGESASVDASTITVNKDVIMPYAWYTAQKKTAHSFYSTGELPAQPTVTTTDSEGTTTTTESGGTTNAQTTPTDTPSNDTTARPADGSTAPNTTPVSTTTGGDGTTAPTTTAPTEGGDTTTAGDDTTTAEGDGTTTADTPIDATDPTESTTAAEVTEATEPAETPTEATETPTEAPTEAPTEVPTEAPTEAPAAPTEAAA